MKARLIDACPSVRVRAKDQVVYVDTQAGATVAEQLADELRVMAEQVPGYVR